MDITCTRPNCEGPQNIFPDLDDNSILKTIQQKYCSSCGMPLILDGRYLPIKLLDKGGFGAAYLACDRRTPALNSCVVKQFQPQAGLSADQIKIAQDLFDREAEVLERLGRQSNQIPKLLAFFSVPVSDSQTGQGSRFFYLAQEYIQGKTLEQLRQEKGRFSEFEVLEVLQSVLGVLQYIHENGVIHRDIKPSNIMRHDNGTYYVLDFGTVKQVTQGVGLSGSSTSVFTAGFAPAEQVAGQTIYPSTDLFALAATALVLLTGKNNLLELFDSYRNRWVWRDQAAPTSDHFAAVLNRMLEPVPSNRFQSAAEVLQALAPLQGSVPNPAQNSALNPQGIDPGYSPTVVNPQRTTNPPAPLAGNLASPPPSGYPQASQSGYPPQSGYPQAPQSGYPPQNANDSPQSPPSGYPQPPQSGYPQAPQSGYPQAPQSGYPQSPQSGYPQAPQSGYPQAPQSGYPPQNQLPQSPQSGYPQSPQSGYPQSPQSGGYAPNTPQSSNTQETQVILNKAPVNVPVSQSSSQSNFLLKVLIGLGAAVGALVFVGVVWALFSMCGRNTAVYNPDQTERLSVGDQLLVKGDGTLSKEEGIKAIAKGDYSEGTKLLEETLAQKPNDPETLIYLNNARIGKDNAPMIAVSVPLDSKDDGTKNAAKEILRGVAQAQDAINKSGGINGQKLKVLVATDANDEASAKKVAETLSKNSEVLGVIGHFSSSATQAAAEVYQKEKLVMMSATSTSTELSKFGDYVFRTVPSDNFTGKVLARYMIERLKKRKAAVFFNDSSGYSKSLRDVFSEAVASNGGEVVQEFNLKRSDFDAKADLAQAKKLGAEAIVLVPNSETLPQSFDVISENSRRLPILGGDSPYRSSTLEKGGKNAEGMVLAVPWHILTDPKASFPKTSRKLWGAEVSWRTAMAYDATEALIAALKEDPTREGVQKALANSNFSTPGASGAIRFLPSGDRNRPMQLVKVVRGKSSSGFAFVPLF